MLSRIASIRRAVKALVTRPRRRVWSGGSRISIMCVEFEHGRLLQRGRAEAANQRVGVAVTLAEAAITQHQGDVLVTGQEPAAERRLQDRCTGAQLAEDRIGIGQEGRIAKIERRRGNGCGHHWVPDSGG